MSFIWLVYRPRKSPYPQHSTLNIRRSELDNNKASHFHRFIFTMRTLVTTASNGERVYGVVDRRITLVDGVYKITPAGKIKSQWVVITWEKCHLIPTEVKYRVFFCAWNEYCWGWPEWLNIGLWVTRCTGTILFGVSGCQSNSKRPPDSCFKDHKKRHSPLPSIGNHYEIPVINIALRLNFSFWCDWTAIGTDS